MKLSNCLLPVPYFGKVRYSILDITLSTEVSPLLTQFVDIRTYARIQSADYYWWQ